MFESFLHRTCAVEYGFLYLGCFRCFSSLIYHYLFMTYWSSWHMFLLGFCCFITFSSLHVEFSHPSRFSYLYVCMYVSLLWESFKLCQSICFSHSWKRWLWTMCSNLDYSWLSPWSKIVSLNCLVLFLWSDRQSMVYNLGSENTLSLIGYDCNIPLPPPKKK